MGILRADRITGLGGANAIKGSVEMRGAQNMRAEIVNGNADFNLGSSNFTIECWYNPGGTTGTAVTLDVDLLMLWNSTNNRRSYGLYYDASGSLGFIGSSDGSNSNMGSFHSYTFPDVNAWYHLAAVRISNTISMYVNGVLLGSESRSGSFYENTVDNLVVGGQLAGTSYDSKIARGFISNMRLIIGDGIYTGAFTPPTNELTVTPNTKLLCCQSPGNILQEATGKTLVAYRKTTNDAFPVASTFTPNTPVGFSTTTDVGSQYGSTFDGFGNFATSTYMVPSGGNTRERNRGRALFAGGYKTPNTITAIDSIEIQSGGLTKQFGDLSTTQHANCSACSSSTRMVTNGGWTGSANNNVMEFVTIANESNSTDFGDLGVGRRNNIAASNQTRGLVYGGNGTPSGNPRVDFFTIATLGDAADFGDASAASAILPAGGSSTTRALFAGGYTPAASDTIDYYTIASTGNATDFGNLVSARKAPGGLSSSTRTLFGGGGVPSSVNSIDFVTTATTGNATDFGDLFLARSIANGTSNQTRGIFMGGSTSPARQDTIDSVTIASKGNAVNWGDFTTAKQNGGVASDSHGGL